MKIIRVHVHDRATLTIHLTKGLDEQLRKFAYDRKVSQSQIIREALAIYFELFSMYHKNEDGER